MVLAAISAVGRIKGRGRRVALDDKLAFALRVEAAEKLHEFGIHPDIAFGIVRLRTIELSRFDADYAFIPAERAPGSTSISFRRKPARAPRRRILYSSALKVTSSFRALSQQRHDVEGSPVAWHVYDLDASKG